MGVRVGACRGVEEPRTACIAFGVGFVALLPLERLRPACFPFVYTDHEQCAEACRMVRAAARVERDRVSMVGERGLSMDEIGKLGFGFMRLPVVEGDGGKEIDRKSTRLNSSH